MTDSMDSALRSKIHQPGCPWSWTSECIEQFERLRSEHIEVAEMFSAMIRRARERGLPPTQNNNHVPRPPHPTHRCPVGDRVRDLPDFAFDDQVRPMPWVGELYAESVDGRTLYRLYFIESRPGWVATTDEIYASAIGEKPVGADGGWTSDDQTADIHSAMISGTQRCDNCRKVWRRWNAA